MVHVSQLRVTKETLACQSSSLTTVKLASISMRSRAQWDLVLHAVKLVDILLIPLVPVSLFSSISLLTLSLESLTSMVVSILEVPHGA